MNVTEDLAVDKARCLRILRKQLVPHVVPDDLENFGPSGFRVVLYENELAVGSVIISQADHDGIEWIHASIAFTIEDPSYQDLVTLKEAVFGPDRVAYQVFPARADHVSIHDHALHLWGRADGEGMLPEFGREGTI